MGADFWRILVWVLPDLYFLSILHSLISRRTIKTMLDSRSLSDGIKIVNGQTVTASSRTRSGVGGRGTFGNISDVGSIKVHVDTLVTEVSSPSWFELTVVTLASARVDIPTGTTASSADIDRTRLSSTSCIPRGKSCVDSSLIASHSPT